MYCFTSDFDKYLWSSLSVYCLIVLRIQVLLFVLVLQ